MILTHGCPTLTEYLLTLVPTCILVMIVASVMDMRCKNKEWNARFCNIYVCVFHTKIGMMQRRLA